jgi:hypothetical protein
MTMQVEVTFKGEPNDINTAMRSLISNQEQRPEEEFDWVREISQLQEAVLIERIKVEKIKPLYEWLGKAVRGEVTMSTLPKLFGAYDFPEEFLTVYNSAKEWFDDYNNQLLKSRQE